MIRVTQLSFGFPGGPTVLRGISLDIRPGMLVGLVGKNGSGKSTLMACLAGLYTPTAGTIQIGQHTSPGDEKSIRQIVGLVLQDADLQILGATVEEDLVLGVPRADQLRRQAARDLAARFGLVSQWEEPVQVLSWGQKRKLSICGILMQQPTVLLLDEPFSGLDYPGIAEMRMILQDGKEHGLTQVVAAHDVEPMADMVDAWAVMSDGGIEIFEDSSTVFNRLREFGVRPPCSWVAGLGVKAWDWAGGNQGE